MTGPAVHPLWVSDRPDPTAYLPRFPEWHERAACRDADRRLFFPSGAGGLVEAFEYCVRCPVRADCLESALDTPESRDFGIWGGTSERERRRIRRRAQR